MNWDDFRVFVTVVDSGGIGRAARRLRLSHATVWRRVRALEQSVGIELFDRSAQGFVPSEAGSVLFQRLRNLDAMIEGGVQAVWDGEGSPRGEVRVCLPLDRLAELVAERVPELKRRYPDLTVELMLEQPLPQTSLSYDIVVSPDAVDLDGFERVGDFALRYGLYASPEYVARRAAGRKDEDETELDFINYDRATRATMHTYARPFVDLLAAYDELPVSFRCSHPYPRKLAARTGMGVILAVEIAVQAEDGLVRIADWTKVGATPLSLHVNASRREERRVVVVQDLMLEVLGVLPGWREHQASSEAKAAGRLKRTG